VQELGELLMRQGHPGRLAISAHNDPVPLQVPFQGIDVLLGKMDMGEPLCTPDNGALPDLRVKDHACSRVRVFSFSHRVTSL